MTTSASPSHRSRQPARQRHCTLALRQDKAEDERKHSESCCDPEDNVLPFRNNDQKVHQRDLVTRCDSPGSRRGRRRTLLQFGNRSICRHIFLPGLGFEERLYVYFTGLRPCVLPTLGSRDVSRLAPGEHLRRYCRGTTAFRALKMRSSSDKQGNRMNENVQEWLLP